MGHVHTLARIRNLKTNYRKRERLLIGRKNFMTVRISGQNVAAQVLRPEMAGDKVITSAHSRELSAFGWKGSLKSLPACYLVGFLLGKRCVGEGVKQVVLYTGIRPFTSRIAACLKGLVEAGITSPHSEKTLPINERINGSHIASYATMLKSNLQDYQSRFSGLLSLGMNPEEYPSHFSEVKGQILTHDPNHSSKVLHESR
ncbi:MAG: 50S ribosomal protein L18 [Thermoproteota archaeon]|nr:50S ribosomal protein L18 [Thermoproteota archaeon]